MQSFAFCVSAFLRTDRRCLRPKLRPSSNVHLTRQKKGKENPQTKKTKDKICFVRFFSPLSWTRLLLLLFTSPPLNIKELYRVECDVIILPVCFSLLVRKPNNGVLFRQKIETKTTLVSRCVDRGRGGLEGGRGEAAVCRSPFLFK